MKDRLIVAKNFITEDGVIFISIDDNEQANLKIIAEEVFGKNNFVGTFVTKQSQRSNAKHINVVHEYVLCFANNIKKLKPFKISRLLITKDKSIINELYNIVQESIKQKGLNIACEEILGFISKLCKEHNISWLKNYNQIDENNKIFFPMDLSTPSKPRAVNIPEIRLFFRNGRPYEKKYLEESEDNAPSILNFFSRQGTNDVKKN